MFGRRKKNAAVPEVGWDAPEFNLPSAQGGQFRLSMRTVRGPVVVAFFRPWSEEDVRFFGALAGKEDEINMAGGSVVGIGVAEADAAREFVGASGIKSYVLYDYVKVTSRQWGLLANDKEHGDYSNPAVFVVGGDHQIANAWTGERPSADDILAAVSAITGLPKPPDEKDEEKPKKGGKAAGDEGEKPKKLTAEEREKIKAERRAAREAGKSVKTGEAAKKPEAETEADKEGGEASGGGEAAEGEKPKKMSAEERARIKAERRAAREAGKSLKKTADSGDGSAVTDDAATDGAPEKKPAEEEE